MLALSHPITVCDRSTILPKHRYCCSTHSNCKTYLTLRFSCRYRIGEVLTAYKLLTSMSKGEAVKGLSLSGKSNPLTLLKGIHYASP